MFKIVIHQLGAKVISDELKELKKISKILTLINAEKLEIELSKYATTDDRKRVWILIDDQKLSKEIAKTIGITQRGVDKFLKQLERAGLIENQYGKAPKKLVEYVPPTWLELIDGN